MRYKFFYKITAFDLWKLSMYGTYGSGSMVGASNIVFTVAIVMLTGKFWNEANIFFRMLMIIGICLFTVIQPLAVYFRAKKQVETIPEDMEIGFDDKGMHVQASNQLSDIKWKSIVKVIKKTNMIIIYTSMKHGFIITDKMLGSQKEDFYNYLVSKIKK